MLGSQGNWDFFTVCRQWKKCKVLNRVIFQCLCGGSEEENRQKNARIVWEAEENMNSRPSNTTFADPLDIVYAKSVIKLGCTLALISFFMLFLGMKCDNFGVLM